MLGQQTRYLSGHFSVHQRVKMMTEVSTEWILVVSGGLFICGCLCDNKREYHCGDDR
jgi:hypothetical protein